MSTFSGLSRRHMLQAGGLGLAGLTLPLPSLAAVPGPSGIDRGSLEGGKPKMPAIHNTETEAPQNPEEPPLSDKEKVGFAVVALGRLTLEELLPAFGETKKAKLAALVSGSPEKLKALGNAHDVPEGSRYSYEEFDRIADNPDVKAVYIVLPNAMHHEFTLRAAKAGKHVLCEKPMANTSAEAQEMVEACAAANVHLMIAYRCQYEPNNRRVIKMAREKTFGEFKLLEAVNGQNQGPPDQWRLKKALAGGGALPDIGLYCLNTIRAITGEEPVEVQAQLFSTPGDPRFTEVEEAVTWLMRFPSGVHATSTTHYGVHKAQTLLAHTPQAAILLENAFAYRGQKLRVSGVEDGVETDRSLTIPQKNQFALEIDHMAECVLTGRKPRTPGEEGLQDHRVMEAIYRSAETGSKVALEAPKHLDAFRGPALPEEK
ncbi:Gfo/Idh/MocA family oxidoreductase [Terrihabitans rhizophilus]|uniref:Gfo/Idh/MocA family oxidoreductase n=1 Tax=Terrihabitans rhizophilus TaxID=3092662 RepID=A0ABU4RPV7_9HYPH|nr:Gfo/Idh/MocA family oxidoreductase [Terrihabitans sp. PJ23]MDX6806864.1 Gfo/Idh/MocA family oxidoreductase [Terrihabitans sp. PJ23]